MTAVNAWRHVDADDDLAADFLAGMVETVIEAGGWIHPSARFVVREGDAHVECEAPEGELLLRVPREAFVRVDRVAWSDSPDALEFGAIPEAFADHEVQLLLLETAFLNACTKLPRLVASHPVLAPDLADEVVAAVQAVQPEFRQRAMSPADVLWSTRAFRLPLAGDGSTERAAVPLVDLLDHDGRGATGVWHGDAFTVDVCRPTGSADCRLDYGHDRDEIDMAIVYGFVDGEAKCRLPVIGDPGERLRLLEAVCEAASQHPSRAARFLADAAAAQQQRIRQAG